MASSPPLCNLTADVSLYNCSNRYPDCLTPGGFQFLNLWTITTYIVQCPNDTRLFDPGEPSLTQAACMAFVGSDDFTWYPPADVWARVTTWKFPLMQLVAVYPRPPLSFGTEVFVIGRLLGNPIGSLKSLLLKTANCQRRADFWSERFAGELHYLIRGEGEDREKEQELRWKGLAVIVDSYDEWGFQKGKEVQDYLYKRLSDPNLTPEEKIKFLDICQRTANALAADRATLFLPLIAALAIFIGTIAYAFGKTSDAAEGPNPTVFTNIEANSIAFSAQYFWIIPALILASMIGVSQTEYAIPRILRRFQTDVDNEEKFREWTQKVPNDHLYDDNGHEIPATVQRSRNGGIYSWQPEDVRKSLIEDITSSAPRYVATPGSLQMARRGSKIIELLKWFKLAPGSLMFSSIIVLSSSAAGLLISGIIPPNGFWCRDWAEIAIAAVWVASAALDYLARLYDGEAHYDRTWWLTFAKDWLAALINMGIVLATQFGILNKCSCYSIEGRTGVAFPEIPAVETALSHNIATGYPAIAFLCLGFELLVFPGIVYWQYGRAFTVLLQRDDGRSNLHRWHRLQRSWVGKAFAAFVGWPVRRIRRTLADRSAATATAGYGSGGDGVTKGRGWSRSSPVDLEFQPVWPDADDGKKRDRVEVTELEAGQGAMERRPHYRQNSDESVAPVLPKHAFQRRS